MPRLTRKRAVGPGSPRKLDSSTTPASETVTTDASYHVFLTPNGDCEGLYVTQKGAASFEVHELKGGKSNVQFDYRIVAHRKGFEAARLPDLTEKFQKKVQLPARVKALASQH